MALRVLGVPSAAGANGNGVALADAVDALAVLTSAPDVLAILTTEVDPENDPAGVHVRRLVDGIVEALARSVDR